MDSDDSGHSESEFYYPEEETLNQMTPINLFSKKNKYVIHRTREKTVPFGPYSRPRAQFFSHADLPHIYIWITTYFIAVSLI